MAVTGGGDSTKVDSMAKISSGIGDSTHLSSAISSQSGIDRRLEPGIFDMITNLPRDWYDWSLQTFQLKNWPYAALITASTAALIVYDHPLWKPFEKLYDEYPTVNSISNDFVFMGDGKFQFGIAGIFAGYGLITGDKRALRTASQTCEVILAAGGVVQLLKHLTGRQSPNRSTTPTGVWSFFPNQVQYAKHTPAYDAFPSGHLTTALATLIVVANNYPEQTWIRPVGYAACAGITLGLVASSIHWWSDFPLAIALGYGFGTLLSPNPNQDVTVTEPPKKKDMGASIEDNRSSLSSLLDRASIAPTFDPTGGAGLSMTLKF
jgi:membrane-associated phospholipid phosphatase